MPKIVTDPAKIVTDPLALRQLEKQGIDKDYVEFFQDYSSEHPSTKFYRDLKSNKWIAVIHRLPKVNLRGERINPRWLLNGEEYHAGANLFTASAKVDGETRVEIQGKYAVWNPQVFIDGIEQFHGAARCRQVDPTNENYIYNILEWDYGVCIRRLRLIEGTIIELWIFNKDPGGDVVIKSNVAGNLPARSYYAIDAQGTPVEGFKVIADEKRIPRESWKGLAYPVIVDDTYTGYSSASDGYIYQDQGGYATVHDASTGTVSDTGTTMYIGQQYVSLPKYNIYRAFVFFDTSTIASDATISAATLSLYGYSDGSVTDFDLTIQNGQPTYPHDPLEAGDYDKTLYSGSGGTLGTSGFVTTGYNDITLDSTGIGWITKGGATKLCLRSSRDIDAIEPTGDEYVVVYTNEQGTGYQPKLVVTYTVPSAFIPRIIII